MIRLRVQELVSGAPLPEDTREVTLEDFVAANSEDEETIAAVEALRPWEYLYLGGGATPIVRVTRIE